VNRQVFDGIKAALAADRFAYLESFLNDSYNADVLGGTRISGQAWHAAFIAALAASAHATHAYLDTWLIDFRPDSTSGPTCARSTSHPRHPQRR
jgi:non-heme chloroperoxidase